MILSDATINKMLADGTLGISPLEPSQIQPASVDIRLARSFAVPVARSGEVLSMESAVEYSHIEAESYILGPGEFVLATTMEYFRLPDNLTAFVEGRSSIGRLGLFIQNAGWVDAGFEGEITLELYNAASVPIELRAGRRVGQLVFAQMDAPALHPYRGKYQGQRGATGSQLHRDHELQTKD